MNIDNNFENNDMDVVKAQLDKLLRLEAVAKAKFVKEEITETQYREYLAKIDQERKKLEEQLDDTIVAMMFTKEVAGGLQDLSDASAMAMRPGKDTQPPLSLDKEEVSIIKITGIKRGMLNQARALEIKFDYRERSCKAVIDSQKGEWHFHTGGEKFYLFQFLTALQNDGHFEEAVEKEVQRHPEDWYEVVVEGKNYAVKGKEKNTRDNFPDLCKHILEQYVTSKPMKHSKTKDADDLSGEPVTIYKVEHGEFSEAGRKDFGKGIMEFPRFIQVALDWGKYRLKAEITTVGQGWGVVPRDPTETYSKELLKKFKNVIPFMVQELGQPRNKYLANAILSEMRIKENRHQWAAIVKGSAAFMFPGECGELFSPETTD
jgi:hypothetical protein